MTTSATPKLLIVEDDLENRIAMVRILAGAGYKTTEKDDGEEAIERILKQDN